MGKTYKNSGAEWRKRKPRRNKKTSKLQVRKNVREGSYDGDDFEKFTRKK